MIREGVVVIGRLACETSRGPLAIGEYRRLPLKEALDLTTAGVVIQADFREQDLPEPLPGRYRRRDLRAAE